MTELAIIFARESARVDSDCHPAVAVATAIKLIYDAVAA
jgi:hypothetical protein